MKTLLLTLFIVSALVSGYSQGIKPCAETKLMAHSKPIKKSRAGSYDNSLMSKYDVHFYFLDLNIERNSTVISGATTIGLGVSALTLDTFCFELNSNLSIDSIVYDNQILSFNRVGSIVYTHFASALVQNTNADIKIYYNGDASVTGAGAIGDGFSTGVSSSWGNRATWSLSEPYSAYEWFPCKQFLQDKCDSVWVFVTTDKANKVGSNGLLEGVDSLLPNNKSRYRWKSHYITDYYLISVAVAKYVDYTIYAYPAAMLGDSIPIVNYVYDNPSTLTTFKPRIDSMPMVLEYYSELFGLYPFADEKYGHCMAPFGGGMEHQTMTSIGNLGSFATNSHELMHQWFGDHVTCKTWKDIFINEGFASYGEYLAYEEFRSLAAAQNLMQDVHDNVLLDSNAMVYFTDTTNVGRIFSSRLTYDKGNAVIHTLRFVLGDSLFFLGLKEFQQNFSFSTASINDLKLSLEASTGKNLNDYFSQWLFGEGYPVFSAEYASDGNHLFLKVSHITSSLNTTLFKTPLEIKCSTTSGDTTITIDITQNTNSFMLPSGRNYTNLSIDPNNWLLNKVGSITKNPALIPTMISSISLEQSIEVYPNPTQDNLQIHYTSSNQATYVLRDLNGKELFQGNLEFMTTLNLSGLSAGVYVLTIASSEGNLLRKIVKH
ncbi:MAG: T9SS type A sorting domain-containing protein [Bacteroidetes bacterium]|nr:T9SS type A sorting domain-containing protein [Bacteroidota bacterium]